MVDAQRKPWAHGPIPEATKESWRRFLARENRPPPKLIAALEQKQLPLDAGAVTETAARGAVS
jgi:hypothetical protein